MAALQIRLVRLRVKGGGAVQTPLLVQCKLDLYFTRDGTCYFPLQRQDVVQASLVALCPQMGLITDADELCGDSHAVPFATQAALQKVRNAQFPSNLLNGLVCGLVLHGGGPCDDAQLVRTKPGKLGDHFLRQTLAKVVVLLTATEVL